MPGAPRGHERHVDADYEHWLKWWRDAGRAELEDLLLRRWAALRLPDEADRRRDVCSRYATRIGGRLRRGVSGEEIADLLAAANRDLGVRVDERSVAAVAMEIRAWYRAQRGDHARTHWPMRYTREET